MDKSTKNKLQEAKSSQIADFQNRFKQKWFKNIPCFHWKELTLSDGLKSVMLNGHPSVWLLTYDAKIAFEDITWDESKVKNFLFFDWLYRELPAIEEAKKEAWYQYNISQGLGMLNFLNNDVVLCYHEGEESFAKEWKTHFESFLK
ncbi:hypothetical protein CW751_12840 [Brumimicrobium salinarum]|uniref:Uncharacterized protein n=1 Tax=Brumimicrobium salinarum TaxID=2058658 RepID=A0A2I0QZT6_9FLAO|nr:hypothetical protein [Brumimicrobium salinarum]PKR79838.1 hypothetical protein CW751_12840 [Brumimicrobium salinarum]